MDLRRTHVRNLVGCFVLCSHLWLIRPTRQPRVWVIKVRKEHMGYPGSLQIPLNTKILASTRPEQLW